MACKCPVCKMSNSSAGTLVEHIVSSQDAAHEKWLESYCARNKIDFGRLILERLNGNKNADKPLAAPLKRDFCKD